MHFLVARSCRFVRVEALRQPEGRFANIQNARLLGGRKSTGSSLYKLKIGYNVRVFERSCCSS